MPRPRVSVIVLLVLLVLAALGSGCDDSASDEQDTSPADTTASDTPDPDTAGDVPGDGQDTSSADTSTSDTAADTPEPDGGDTTACTPDCAGRQCGDDGCGGRCGTCDTATQTCDEAAGLCTSSTTCEPGCTASDCPQGCFDLGACAPSGDAMVNVWPSVRTAGLLASGATLPETAELYYRASGAATWSRGHDATRIPDGRLASSLFWLAPATAYELMLRTADGRVACASLETLDETPAHETLTTLHVDATAAPGGDGSPTAPFATLQAALDAAAPGTDLVVAAGVYRESLTVSVSGEPGRYVRILGESGAVLDGSDPQATQPAWTADGDRVWRTPWTRSPSYLARDQQRLYHFESLAELRAGTGHGAVPMDEGWIVDGGLLYVRSSTDPATHTWQLPALGTAIAIDGESWIWIQGLEIRHFGEGEYPKGIDVRDGSHIVIRGNHVHDTPAPVWVRRASSHVRIEENTIHQSSVFDWPWAAVKGTDHENSAITLAGADSQLAARNEIHDIFNGVVSGSFDAQHDTTLALDVDVYGNRMWRIGDDGLEPEGATVNNRFWGNTIDETHNGISLAPITAGPVWILRNRVTDYRQSGLKVSNDSSGRVWLYHNTCWVDGPDQNGMGVSGPFHDMVFRNNIIRGTRYALESGVATTGNDLDYDNLYTTRGAPVVKWDDVRYDDLAALCTATGLECHAQPEDPALLDPAAGRFALTEDSPNVDAGLHLYGINDGFAGNAPDLGYVELGTTEP